MSDEKDQTSSGETTPRYRALRDGTGYKEGEIFQNIESLGLSGNGVVLAVDKSDGYRIHGTWVPIFNEDILRVSPDFELVEEIKPEPKYTIIFRNYATKEFIRCLYFDSDPFYTKDYSVGLSEEVYQVVHVLGLVARGREGTVQIVEVKRAGG